MLPGLTSRWLPVLFFLFAVTASSTLASGQNVTRQSSPPAAQMHTLTPDSPVSSSSGSAGGPTSPAPHPAARSGGVFRAPAQPIIIPRLTTAPVLNDFLGSRVRAAAAQMLRIDRFVERYPRDGELPTNSTAAFLGYTHQYLFVAFVCHARRSKLVRGHLMPRDLIGNDDNVRVMLDTFYDHRRAFVFKTNPLGTQADALFSEQSGYDFSFDTVWDSWGQRTPWGYVVLMRIPFPSLYFAKALPGQLRTWGIILERIVGQTKEQDYWPQNQHNVAGKLTQDMKVEGFADIAKGRTRQFEPYSLARNLRQLNVVNPTDPYFQSKHLQAYGGLDSKFILRNSLVLDTTLNPDFSQVGVNNPALPNQRFPFFFPEVRPFFIENSSYFMTPFNLYYTDNIVTPQFGARLTGKLGPWALGILGVDDRSPGQSVPQGSPEYGSRAHFYVARMNRDIGTQTDVGLIYTDREYLSSFNRTGGVDYRARVHHRWTFTGQAVTSETRNISNSTVGEQKCLSLSLSCSGQGYYNNVNYYSLHNQGWIGYTDVAAGYVTDTGFFQRPDVREVNGSYNYVFRTYNSSFLFDHAPGLYFERIWDHHGVPLDFYFNPSYFFDFTGHTHLSLNLSFGQDRLRPIDYPALTQDVEHHSHTAGFSLYTSPVPDLALGLGYTGGRVINYKPALGQGPGPVNMVSPNISVEFEPSHYFDLQNTYIFTHFTNVKNGDLAYDNHQLITRWNYQMNQALSVSLIGQYISTLPDARYTQLTSSKTLFADALFTYMPHPGTAVYVGYIGNFANIARALCTWQAPGQCNPNDPILPPTGSSMINDGKTVYVKVSYLLRF